jgi:phage tail tube protein FII
MRMTDRWRGRATRQALYVWHEREPVGLWRDFAMTMDHEGFLGRSPSLTLPAVMRLLQPGSASDVPALVRVAGTGNDELEMTFEPAEYVRIVVPSEVDPQGVVVLNEISGSISARGRVAGRVLDVEATGVFELLH